MESPQLCRSRQFILRPRSSWLQTTMMQSYAKRLGMRAHVLTCSSRACWKSTPYCAPCPSIERGAQRLDLLPHLPACYMWNHAERIFSAHLCWKRVSRRKATCPRTRLVHLVPPIPPSQPCQQYRPSCGSALSEKGRMGRRSLFAWIVWLRLLYVFDVSE